MSKINKKKIKSLLSYSLGINKKEIDLVINSLIDAVKIMIEKGDRVHMGDFGTIYAEENPLQFKKSDEFNPSDSDDQFISREKRKKIVFIEGKSLKILKKE